MSDIAGTKTDVLIVGGGFAGLAAGSMLAATGLTTTVIDAGATGSFRGELLHPAGVRALTHLGLKPALLSADAVPVPGFAAYAAGASDAVLLPYPKDAGLGLAVDHTTLVETLRQDFLSRLGTRLVTGRGEQILFQNGRATGVRLADGEELSARLVVVADGRHSRLRSQLKVPTIARLLSFTLAPVLENCRLPHPGYGHVFVGAPGPVLAYPYGRDRVRMCIDVPTGIKGGRKGLVEYVRAHYAQHVPEPLRSAMLAALDRGDCDSSANHAVSTLRCIAPGVALLGDAGGCSHPVTATGLTTALHDITTLSRSIAARGLGDEALREYQRRHYRFVHAREVFAQSLYEVFLSASGSFRGLCDGLFEYWRTSERSRLASMAILSGDDSRLTSFASEYGRVVARSLSSVVRHRGRELWSDFDMMRKTAGGCLGLALQKAVATANLEFRDGEAGELFGARLELPAEIAGRGPSTLRRMGQMLVPASVGEFFSARAG